MCEGVRSLIANHVLKSPVLRTEGELRASWKCHLLVELANLLHLYSLVWTE